MIKLATAVGGIGSSTTRRYTDRWSPTGAGPSPSTRPGWRTHCARSCCGKASPAIPRSPCHRPSGHHRPHPRADAAVAGTLPDGIPVTISGGDRCGCGGPPMAPRSCQNYATFVSIVNDNDRPRKAGRAKRPKDSRAEPAAPERHLLRRRTRHMPYPAAPRHAAAETVQLISARR